MIEPEDDADDEAVLTEADEEEPRRAIKSASAFRTISEVADDLAVPQHVLRFWETKFPQIRPLKRGGGRRYYRPEDVDLLRRVGQLLYQEGYTIRGVQRLLREGSLGRPVRPPAQPAPSQAMLLPLDIGVLPEPVPTQKRSKPTPPAPIPSLPEPVADPLARAILEEILEELRDLRDLLPHRDR
jgi:DNA-binding transcriptional MerR regulator